MKLTRHARLVHLLYLVSLWFAQETELRLVNLEGTPTWPQWAQDLPPFSLTSVMFDISGWGFRFRKRSAPTAGGGRPPAGPHGRVSCLVNPYLRGVHPQSAESVHVSAAQVGGIKCSSGAAHS